MPSRIELIYVSGCPNVATARDNLRRALIASGRLPIWDEWEQTDPEAPPHVRRFGSPTVLVSGRDVTGAGPTTTGAACRADGAPSVQLIRSALDR